MGVPEFVKLALLVIEIVLVPLEAGVYLNVAGVELPEVIETVLGEKVPPAPESDGVITTVDPSIPLGVTVKLELCAPCIPDVGPDNPSWVAAAADTVRVYGDPVSAKLALLLKVIVLVPLDEGV
jgi:hypothetical protein